MLREEVKAICDLMGANLQVKPESVRGCMKSLVSNWSASITHPEVPYYYSTRGARSNHQAASEVLWLFLKEFEKDKKVYVYGGMLRQLLDAAAIANPPIKKARSWK